MAKCRYCSAPMRANNQNCEYCGVRNDVDLHGRLAFNLVRSESDRVCPNCERPMQTIDLKIGGKFYIERCESCHGLFFDRGEIEDVLEHGVSHDHEINRQLIENVSKDRYQADRQVRYRKCPVCRDFMARRNFGHLSGVVVDRCNQHGVWLDQGELIHLLEWKKAGGQILHEKRESRRQATEARQSGRAGATISSSSSRSGSRLESAHSRPPDLEDLVGDALSSLVKRFFG